MSRRSSSSNDKPPRQLPGLACEECRKRKLRCDRQEPRCTICVDVGKPCIINPTRSPRGPPKGHIRALQARIAALEVSLTQQQMGMPSLNSLVGPGDQLVLDGTLADGQSPEISNINTEMAPLDDEFVFMDPFGSYPSTSEICISDLMREDLDQLYFDRVHPFAPLLQQRRYASWKRTREKSKSRSCLQHAMWTCGIALSTQFQHLDKSLYKDTKRLLEELANNDSKIDAVDIEQVQAWILVAIYEFIRSDYNHGWISAGRCFRLVQRMKLFRVDTPDGMHAQGDWIETEEKRRAFWMAYSLDRFASIRNDWPLTLDEQAIMTRLPAPELEFQSGQPIIMGFLSETLSTTGQSTLSPWAECLIMTTILGRALSHRNQAATAETVLGVFPSSTYDFWERHQCVNTLLTQRINAMLLRYPATSQHVDPMLLFAKMLARTTVLYLYKTMDKTICKMERELMVRINYKSFAAQAAQELVDLTKTLARLSYFKIHPFTPVPLYLCAAFFRTSNDANSPNNDFDTQLGAILQALQDLKTVNHMAESFLQLLEYNDYTDLGVGGGM